MKCLAVACALAVAALTACGDGGDASSATTVTTAAPSTTASTAPPTTTTQPSTTTTERTCTSAGDVDQWPVAQRAAQLIVIPSLDFNVSDLAPSIRAGAGGVLFLGHGSTPSDLPSQLAAAAGSDVPQAVPLVMADVEGGGIQRVEGAVQDFPWARDMAADMSVDQVKQLAQTVGDEMVRAGVNVDLAPVLDLDDRPGPSSTNPDGERSFSIDPATASAYGIAFLQGLRNAGVVPVVKHFPGLGGSTENTDVGPAATLPYAELQTAGLKPFIDAIAAGAPAIMVSNAYTPGLTTAPASVSPTVIQDLLREQLGFTGLVVTDSLSAGAITDAGYDVPQAAAASVEAGADMILYGSTLTAAETALLSPPNVEATRQAIVAAMSAAVASGELAPARLDQAVLHVLAAKGVDVCPA
jgi:beta-N-acetylhexosaminidase